MLPQILQQLGEGLKISPQIRQMISMVKTAGNPQMMLNQIMQMNPQLKQVMEIVNQYGGDANKAFYDLAEKNGINPQEILDMLKGI